MDSATAISSKNALDLLKGISLSTNLQKSKDSILLAEDQYPPKKSLRATLQLTPNTDNPWEKHTFKDWKHRVTNICLQAVQKALKNYDKSSSSFLFTPQDSTAATSVHSHVSSKRSHTKSNIEGLLLYHPLIVQHPWEPTKDLDRWSYNVLKLQRLSLVA